MRISKTGIETIKGIAYIGGLGLAILGYSASNNLVLGVGLVWLAIGYVMSFYRPWSIDQSTAVGTAQWGFDFGPKEPRL